MSTALTVGIVGAAAGMDAGAEPMVMGGTDMQHPVSAPAAGRGRKHARSSGQSVRQTDRVWWDRSRSVDGDAGVVMGCWQAMTTRTGLEVAALRGRRARAPWTAAWRGAPRRAGGRAGSAGPTGEARSAWWRDARASPGKRHGGRPTRGRGRGTDEAVVVLRQAGWPMLHAWRRADVQCARLSEGEWTGKERRRW